jgi:hypothetical protein
MPIEIFNWRTQEVEMVIRNWGSNTCGIQSQETAKGWEIFVGNSIKDHTRIAMGSNKIDLEKARENRPINLFQLHYKKGISKL